MDGKFEDADLNILKLEQKLKLTDTELNLKEKLLIEAEEKCNFSENKLKKIEDYLEAQKGTLVEMENKFEQSEKVSKHGNFPYQSNPFLLQEKERLRGKVFKLESDDTMERVIEELKHQHQEDLKRVTKVELE